MLIAILLFTQVLMSGKCNSSSGPSTPSPTTKQIHVMLSPNWIASWPQAFNCSGSGPRIGNNPSFDNGSTSFYTSTNLRFTEVRVRDLVTQSLTSTKLWANNSGGSGNEVVVDAPLNNGYEIQFTQYDGCSSACLQAQTSQGIRPTRLLWKAQQTFGQYGSTYVTLTPQYNSYSVCN